MPSQLIDRLTEDLGYPRVTAKTLDNAEPKVDEVFSAELIKGAEVEKKDLPGAREPNPALSN